MWEYRRSERVSAGNKFNDAREVCEGFITRQYFGVHRHVATRYDTLQHVVTSRDTTHLAATLSTTSFVFNATCIRLITPAAPSSP